MVEGGHLNLYVWTFSLYVSSDICQSLSLLRGNRPDPHALSEVVPFIRRLGRYAEPKFEGGKKTNVRH